MLSWLAHSTSYIADMKLEMARVLFNIGGLHLNRVPLMIAKQKMEWKLVALTFYMLLGLSSSSVKNHSIARDTDFCSHVHSFTRSSPGMHLREKYHWWTLVGKCRHGNFCNVDTFLYYFNTLCLFLYRLLRIFLIITRLLLNFLNTAATIKMAIRLIQSSIEKLTNTVKSILDLNWLSTCALHFCAWESNP